MDGTDAFFLDRASLGGGGGISLHRNLSIHAEHSPRPSRVTLFAHRPRLPRFKGAAFRDIHMMKDSVNRGEIEKFQWVDTKTMLADVFA